MKPWVIYSLVRVGMFAVIFAALMLLGFEWWLAAIVATIVSLCIAYLFFTDLRNRVAADLFERRHGSTEPQSDEAAEDRE